MKKGKINGCNIGAYSRLAKKCRECMNKEYCKNKQMQAEAYIIPQPIKNISPMANGITTEEATEALQRATVAIYKAMKAQEEVLYGSRKNT